MPRLARTELRQPDGRRVYLYGRFTAAPPGYEAPALGSGAYQRRWNPLRQEWVLVAASRQGRTFLPERAACPLCPSTPEHSSEIPASGFEVAVFENRFPAMRSGAPAGDEPPPQPSPQGGGRGLDEASPQGGGSEHVAEPSAGVCEVVVYTDQHEGSFGTLPAARLERLMEVWTDRYRELGARADVRYVFIFENRGEAVGVTLHHPHGQIYAYPFIPPVVEVELRAGRSYARRRGGCLQCALIASERESRERMVIHEAGVAAYLPAYARWPYEVHVASTAHFGALPDLAPALRRSLGRALQRVAAAYDRLFDAPMPYMMVIHQRPTDGRAHPQAHLHVEFYPILRDRGKPKYLAGCESGAGTFVNDTLAEERAAALRGALDIISR